MYLGRAASRQRFFATAVKSADAAAPASAVNFTQVKFVSEPVEQVAQEVPKFQFYEMPDGVCTNVYRNHLMSAPIKDLAHHAEAPLGKKPEVQYSQLENGLKIASIDQGGESASLGLFVNAGSRYERVDMQGTSHMTAMAAYKSTAHLSYLRIAKTLETLGVKADASAGREVLAYRSLLDREYMPIVAPLLVGNILYPRLLQWEINPLHEKIDKYQGQMDDSDKVSDMLHSQAFLNNTLGWNAHAQPKHVTHFTGEVIREYMMEHFSPDRMVMVGVNVDHAELAKWTMRSFVDYNTIPAKPKTGGNAVYVGGDRRAAGASKACNISIGYHFEGGWSSKDLMALNVWQTSLGGCSKNFASEMGSGASRLTSLVTGGVSSCLAFSNVYSDAGLAGVSAVVAAADVPAYLQSVGSALQGSGSIAADELTRAKSVLKTNLMLSTESPEKMMEDMGRQMVMSGKVLTTAEINAQIDAVTTADVQRVASALLATKPTVASYGGIEYVPSYENIANVLANAAPAKPAKVAAPAAPKAEAAPAAEPAAAKPKATTAMKKQPAKK